MSGAPSDARDAPSLETALAALPPKARLAAVLHAMTRQLPATHATLLAAPELEDGKATLVALSSPGEHAAVLAALAPEEAGWMAGRLLQAWQRAALIEHPPMLDPMVWIDAPDDAWFPTAEAGGTFRLTLGAALLGLDPGADMHWPEGAAVADDGLSAVLSLPAVPGRGHEVVLRVAGRVGDGANGAGQRTVLVARHVVTPRALHLLRDGTGSLVLAHDGSGRPAADLAIVLDGRALTVPPDGRIRLDAPLSAGATATFEGRVIALGEVGNDRAGG